MLKKTVAVVGGLLLAVLVLAGVSYSGRGPLAYHPPPVDLPLSQVTQGHRTVHVRGTAHYPVRVKLTVKPNFYSPLQTRWVFPLFERGDTMSKEIHWLVTSTVPPDELASFEDRELTAIVRRPTTRRLNKATLEAFMLAGYDIADDLLVLEDMAP